VKYYISEENKGTRRGMNRVLLGHIWKSVFGVVDPFLRADTTLTL